MTAFGQEILEYVKPNNFVLQPTFSHLLQGQIIHCQFSWTVAYTPLQKLLEANSFKYYNLVLVAFDLFSKITHFIKPFKKAHLSTAHVFQI